jgi:DNA-binding NtrC family response regulator
VTAPQVVEPGPKVLDLVRMVDQYERLIIEGALEMAKGNRHLAARILGVSRSTLYYKLRKHGMAT